MIVSEDDVSAALAYLSEDPHPIALARKDLADAENKKSDAYNKEFMAADGSVQARKCQAEISEAYIKAREAEREASYEVERHRQRINAADKLLDIYRTENANARAAERIR